MHTKKWILTAVLLAGCGGDDGTDTSTTTGCEATVKDQYPADGATDAFYRSGVWLRLNNATGPEITVTQGGTEVAGSTTFEGDVARFTPDTPFASETAFDVLVTDGGCDVAAFGFTTSSAGSSIDATTLVDRTYRLTLQDGAPPPEQPNMQAVIDLAEEDLLLTVTAASADTVDAVTGPASGSGENQNLCIATTPVSLDFSNNPFGEGEVPAGYASLVGSAVPTFGGYVSGAFSPDGANLEGIDLQMTLDMATASVVMGEDVCELLVTFGVICQPCPSGTGDCMTFHVQQITGVDDGSPAVVTITEDDVANNPDCP